MNEKIRTTLFISKKVHKKFKVYCSRKNKRMCKVVEKLIKEYLKEVKK